MTQINRFNVFIRGVRYDFEETEDFTAPISQSQVDTLTAAVQAALGGILNLSIDGGCIYQNQMGPDGTVTNEGVLVSNITYDASTFLGGAAGAWLTGDPTLRSEFIAALNGDTRIQYDVSNMDACYQISDDDTPVT